MSSETRALLPGCHPPRMEGVIFGSGHRVPRIHWLIIKLICSQWNLQIWGYAPFWDNTKLDIAGCRFVDPIIHYNIMGSTTLFPFLSHKITISHRWHQQFGHSVFSTSRSLESQSFLLSHRVFPTWFSCSCALYAKITKKDINWHLSKMDQLASGQNTKLYILNHILYPI